jgi:menaquinone-dependent protoporphyrinogen oxidase
MKVLIAYASIHGSTAETAQFIARILESYSVDVTVANVKDVDSVEGYDAFVLGSAIEGGMWLHEMSVFMTQFKHEIASKPAFLFITCIRVLEADGYEHTHKYYVHHDTVQQLGIHDIAVFAGRLNVDVINWDERWLLALQYDGSEIPGRLNHDYRDWQAIGSWAIQLAHTLAAVPVFADGAAAKSLITSDVTPSSSNVIQ